VAPTKTRAGKAGGGEIGKESWKGADQLGNQRRCRLRRRFPFPINQSLPAKLLKAVQPIYPPDAMRNYITGDVRIEAGSGQAGADRRDEDFAGAEAVRQWRWTRCGSMIRAGDTGREPVASNVTVTIKFWFDP